MLRNNKTRTRVRRKREKPWAKAEYIATLPPRQQCRSVWLNLAKLSIWPVSDRIIQNYSCPPFLFTIRTFAAYFSAGFSSDFEHHHPSCTSLILTKRLPASFAIIVILPAIPFFFLASSCKDNVGVNSSAKSLVTHACVHAYMHACMRDWVHKCASEWISRHPIVNQWGYEIVVKLSLYAWIHALVNDKLHNMVGVKCSHVQRRQSNKENKHQPKIKSTSLQKWCKQYPNLRGNTKQTYATKPGKINIRTKRQNNSYK